MAAASHVNPADLYAIQVAEAARDMSTKCMQLTRSTTGMNTSMAMAREKLKARGGEYQVCLTKMDAHSGQHLKFACYLTDADWSLDAYEKQLSSFFAAVNKLYSKSGGLDKWDPENFKLQLAALDDIGKDVQTAQQKMSQLVTAALDLDMMQAVLTVDSMLSSDDKLAVIRKSLQDMEQTNDLQQKQRAERAEKEIAAEIAVRYWETLMQRKVEQQQHTDKLKAEREALERRIKDLDDQAYADAGKQKDILQAQIKESEAAFKELQKQQEATIKKHQDEFSEYSRRMEQKASNLAEDLVDIANKSVTHMIGCFDKSWSMSLRSPGSPTRSQALLSAFASFESVRDQMGCTDLKSIILFNETVERVITCQELPDASGTLQARYALSGGTSFVPAWRDIKECAGCAPRGAHTFVLFVTDGDALDIPQASAAAEELYKSRKDVGGMTTVIINVDGEADMAKLNCLVKAGNGGKDTINVCGVKRDLLLSVKAWDMTRTFQDLGGLASVARQDVKLRINLAREQERQARLQQKAGVEEIAAFYKAKQERMAAINKQAQNANNDDAELLSNLVKRHRMALLEQKSDVEALLSNAQHRLQETTEEEGKAAIAARHAKEGLIKDQARLEKVEESFGVLMDVHAESISQAVGLQRQLLADHHTSDVNAIVQQIGNLRRFLTQYGTHMLSIRSAASALGNLRRFQQLFAQRIREPLSDVVGSLSQTGLEDFVFRQLLHERGLEDRSAEGERWASTANVRLYLEFETRASGHEEDDAAEIVRAIVQSGMEAADLCSGCLVEKKDDREQQQKAVVGKVETSAFERAGFSSKDDSEENLKKRHESLKVSHRESIKDKDVLEFKLERAVDEKDIEATEEALVKARGNSETLEAEIEKLETRREDVKRVKADCRDAKKIVARAFEHCYKAYDKRAAQQQLENAKEVFGEAYHNVVLSIHEFREFVKLQQDLQAESADCRCDGGQVTLSTGLKALFSARKPQLCD